MERILCPFHAESTPSLVLYPKGYRCYGCGATGPLSDLGGKVAEMAPKERYVEDLREARKYVESLPRKVIRGFNLPYDAGGYYLCWPNFTYYKRRNWDDGKSKYKNPSGHTQPVFWARREHHPTLCVSEGEFNALSVARAFTDWDVCSPGSASDFKSEKTRKFLLTYCTRYRTIVLMADYDGPGTEAAIHAKGMLVGRVPVVNIVFMKRDANQVLCESGKEELKKEIENCLSQGL